MASERLDETTARATALAWHSQLASDVQLRLVHPDSIVGAPKYEWIEVDLDAYSRDQVGVVRAAGLVWLALACCPGYGMTENPYFWERVFKELRKKELGPNGIVPGGVSAIGDMPKSDNPDDPDELPDYTAAFVSCFPLHLQAPLDLRVATARVFCGKESSHDSVRDTMLVQIVQLLASSIDKQRWNHATIEYIMSLESLQLDSLEAFRSVGDAVDGSRALTTRAQEPRLLGLPPPEFHLVGFHANQLRVNETPRSIDDVCVRTMRIERDCTTIRQLTQLLWDLLAIQRPLQSSSSTSSTGGVRSIDINYRDVSPVTLAAILSALPFCQSMAMTTVRYTSKPEHPMIRKQQQRDLTSTELAWLGYAIFHPDARHSSWRNLEFQLAEATTD